MIETYIHYKSSNVVVGVGCSGGSYNVSAYGVYSKLLPGLINVPE